MEFCRYTVGLVKVEFIVLCPLPALKDSASFSVYTSLFPFILWKILIYDARLKIPIFEAESLE